MRFEEQIMPIDKYPTEFPRQMEAIVFIIPQTIFRKTRSLKLIGEYHSDILQFQLEHIQSHDAFRPKAKTFDASQ